MTFHPRMKRVGDRSRHGSCNQGGNGDVALPWLSVLRHLGLRELHHGPARVAILLPQLCRPLRPRVRNLVRLDVGLLGVGVALLWRRHDGGVHDLAAHREVAGPGEVLVEQREQVLDRLRLREVFAEQPDRLGVGNPVTKAQPEEAYEGQPILL